MKKKRPEDKHGPIIADKIQDLAKEIWEECRASSIEINCTFSYDKDNKATSGKGHLKLNIRVSKDAANELVGDVAAPKGTFLYGEVERRLVERIKHRVSKQKGG